MIDDMIFYGLITILQGEFHLLLSFLFSKKKRKRIWNYQMTWMY